MAKYTANVPTTTANPSVYICDIDRRRGDTNNWEGTAFLDGTFAGGTVTLQFSPDEGTTKITGKDWTGNALSATSASMFVFQPMGNGNVNGDRIQVYASITGATGSGSPGVTAIIFDNR